MVSTGHVVVDPGAPGEGTEGLFPGGLVPGGPPMPGGTVTGGPPITGGKVNGGLPMTGGTVIGGLPVGGPPGDLGLWCLDLGGLCMGGGQ